MKELINQLVEVGSRVRHVGEVDSIYTLLLFFIVCAFAPFCFVALKQLNLLFEGLRENKMTEEYKTLDEWFEGKDRGDGRRFTMNSRPPDHWMEPFFRDNQGYWQVRHHNGESEEVSGIRPGFCIWHPPKKTKRVKMYAPIFKARHHPGYELSPNCSSWKIEKGWSDPVVGWHEIEVEVED